MPVRLGKDFCKYGSLNFCHSSSLASDLEPLGLERLGRSLFGSHWREPERGHELEEPGLELA